MKSPGNPTLPIGGVKPTGPTSPTPPLSTGSSTTKPPISPSPITNGPAMTKPNFGPPNPALPTQPTTGTSLSWANTAPLTTPKPPSTIASAAPAITMNTQPIQTGMTQDQPPAPQMSMAPAPVAQSQPTPPAASTPAAPWDDPNYKEPTPPPADTYAGQGAAMSAADTQAEKDKTLQAQAGQSQASAMATADQNKTAPSMTMRDAPVAQVQATPDPAVNAVTTPVKTDPSLDDSLKHFEDIATQWANGVIDDKVFKTTANRAVLQMGLNNQAQMDALQMRINADPALRGQGAGSAMLSMMAANQNFSASQMFGMLAQDAQQKILDMQKYGVTMGVQINSQRRQNAFKDIAALQDAGDFTGAAKLLAKTVDFPGVTIDPNKFTASRSRTADDITTLMTAGNYDGAAAKMSQLTGSPVDAAQLKQRDPALMTRAIALETKGDFEGAAKAYADIGLNLTADDLRAQSPFMQDTWRNTLDGIKAIAGQDPAAAEAQLAILMKNPAAAKYLGFTANMNPKDLIDSIVSGKYQAEQSFISGLNVEINRQAKSGVSFSNALVNYKQQGPAAWQGMEDTGKNLATTDITKFNDARSAMGMGPVHKDANGNIVDANGTALTPEDFGTTAAAQDYLSRKDQLGKSPWTAAYDQLMAPDSAFHDKILSIPGGEQTVKEALQSLYLGGSYKLDPQTNTMVPDYTGGMPWDSASATSYLFHDWPTAVFKQDGSVDGKYDLGGDPYGLDMGSGQKLQKMPDDQNLDNLYAKYKYNKGTLSSSEWYFATAGGTRPPDLTKIPQDATRTQGAEDLTKPGLNGGGTVTIGGNPTPSSTFTPGSAAASIENFKSVLAKTGGFTSDEARSTFEDWANTMNSAYKSAPAGQFTDLKTGAGSDFDVAIARLKDKGQTANLSKIVSRDLVDSNGTRVSSSSLTTGKHYAYTGLPTFADYTIYAKMLANMNEADAKSALTALIGADRANAALALENPTGTAIDDVAAAEAAARAKG